MVDVWTSDELLLATFEGYLIGREVVRVGGLGYLLDVGEQGELRKEGEK